MAQNVSNSNVACFTTHTFKSVLQQIKLDCCKMHEYWLLIGLNYAGVASLAAKQACLGPVKRATGIHKNINCTSDKSPLKFRKCKGVRDKRWGFACFPFFVDDVHWSWNSTGILLLGMNGIALPCPELSHKYPSIYLRGGQRIHWPRKIFSEKTAKTVSTCN